MPPAVQLFKTVSRKSTLATAAVVLLLLVPACDRGESEQVKELRARVSELQSESDARLEQKEAAARRVEELEEENEALAEQVQELEDRVEELSELQDAARRLRESRARVTELEERVEELKAAQPAAPATEEPGPELGAARERLRRLGGELMDQGRYDIARRVLLAGHGLGLDDPETLHRIAFCEAAGGNNREAVEWYERALGAMPDDGAVALRRKCLNNYGAALLRLDEVERAADAFRRAIDIDAAYAPAHFNLGLALRRLGRTDRAIESFREHVAHGGGRSVTAREFIRELQAGQRQADESSPERSAETGEQARSSEHAGDADAGGAGNAGSAE
jgi:tetratricopeptide (TPR) repeat protein